MDTRDMETQVGEAQSQLQNTRDEIAKRIVGQKKMIDGLLMGLLADGHVLIEGVPGLAKTLAVKTIAEVLDVSFKRIQFTPDLLPADLIGTMVYRQQTGEFIPRKGPVFSNLVLADEINRSPAKVQSALLEAMEERQITISENTFVLPKPFFVMATQNPIEQEGTYPLPEAELDRFLLKVVIDYPSMDEELEIIRRVGSPRPIGVSSILNPYALEEMKKAASRIKIDQRIEEYIVSISTASRFKDRKKFPISRYIEYGASPRASIYLYRCAKVKALFEGRTFVIPEDVKEVAVNVLAHRIVLSYEAESEELTGADVVSQLLQTVPVP
ncbi:MAG: AAA family ATPase [Spirochaetales bacterium]|nr:AAA family ATPase [Spirochaetales bacterium]MCF7938151.1 AAA family ATPase [Spirochaetales bacterium]